MSEEIELFRPSNGTMGEIFIDGICSNCAKYRSGEDSTTQCDILMRTMLFDIDEPEYPNKWRYIDGEPTCTAFKDREEFNAERRAKRKPANRCSKTVDIFEVQGDHPLSANLEQTND